MTVLRVNAIKDLPFYPLAEVLYPTCYQCEHYLNNDKCKAFPNGIPRKLLRGPYWHIALLPQQQGNFIFKLKE